MKDLIIPDSVTAFNNIEEAIEGTDYIVLSVPSHVIRSMCKVLKGKISKDDTNNYQLLKELKKIVIKDYQL